MEIAELNQEMLALAKELSEELGLEYDVWCGARRTSGYIQNWRLAVGKINTHFGSRGITLLMAYYGGGEMAWHPDYLRYVVRIEEHVPDDEFAQEIYRISSDVPVWPRELKDRAIALYRQRRKEDDEGVRFLPTRRRRS